MQESVFSKSNEQLNGGGRGGGVGGGGAGGEGGAVGGSRGGGEGGGGRGGEGGELGIRKRRTANMWWDCPPPRSNMIQGRSVVCGAHGVSSGPSVHACRSLFGLVGPPVDLRSNSPSDANTCFTESVTSAPSSPSASVGGKGGGGVLGGSVRPAAKAAPPSKGQRFAQNAEHSNVALSAGSAVSSSNAQATHVGWQKGSSAS